MSRGPGKWQRLILEEVSKNKWFYLIDLLPDKFTMSQYKALYRAASRLADTQRIAYHCYMCGRKKVLLGPFGFWPPAKRPRMW